MQIEIRARGFALTGGLRAHAARRLRFALARFDDRVERAAVRLADVNGPRGGIDKHCRVQLRVRGLPDIVIEDREADLYIALDRAVGRAGRALGRQLRRLRGNPGRRTGREDYAQAG